MKLRTQSLVAGMILFVIGHLSAQGQAVQVTASLDTNLLNVGQTTTLRIFAQVVPALRPQADRIFSWYVDVINTNVTVATADYDSLVKATSDNDPLISGIGSDDGADRRGIYDTFLGLAGAGVSNAVELMAIPIMAAAGGSTQFAVKTGSGVENLDEDFIVAPIQGGAPFTGGDYGIAVANLEVIQACTINLQITRVNGGGVGEQLSLSFVPCSGFDHTVEFTEILETGAVWQSLPGSPHNSGMVSVTNTVAAQFFRVRADLQ